MASSAENVSIWWRHHAYHCCALCKISKRFNDLCYERTRFIFSVMFCDTSYVKTRPRYSILYLRLVNSTQPYQSSLMTARLGLSNKKTNCFIISLFWCWECNHKFDILNPCCVLRHDGVIKWNGNSPVTNEFLSQMAVTQSFVGFFDLRLKIRLNKQSCRRWFETPSHTLWRHCNVNANEFNLACHLGDHYSTYCPCALSLTHWGRDKMTAILQPTLTNAFSWMKIFEFRLKFH